MLPLLLAALTLGLVGLSCTSPARSGSLSEHDVAAIRATLESMVAAELAGDWAAAAEMCTEDHVAMPSNRPTLVGRQAWLEWVSSFDIQFEDMRAAAVEIDGRADLAYLRGTYSEAFTPEGSAESVQRTGKFLWILRKESDGAWRVAVAIGNPDAPPHQPSPGT
jgi:ketosteroid isomerase-like protein